MSKSGSAVVWFRKCLRLHDNAALLAACERVKKDNLVALYPLFILDPWFAKECTTGTNRFGFLLESLRDLDQSLRKMGSQLIVLKGNPETVFPAVLRQWDVRLLAYEADTEAYALARDAKVATLAANAGASVEAPCGHTLYDTQLVAAAAGGQCPKTLGSFQKIIAKLGPPPSALPAPTSMPPIGTGAGVKAGLEWYGDAFGEVPGLEALGREQQDHTTPYHGGETLGLARMEAFLADQPRVLGFEKPKTAPTALTPDTTVLSPYLKFGCVSIRRFYHRLRDMEKGQKHTQPPVSLVGQCLWREFFYTCSVMVPCFDRMKGNPICKQIPWEADPAREQRLLAAWKEGRTGYPWIDAAMTQLRVEGWMHHLARHAVACFLTRGDLWVHWERGRDVFDELLLDADPALNNANWMWLSASSFFYQFSRVYSPIAFPKKTDPEGAYVRKWLPQLKKLPKKYIYEPWTAPPHVLQAAGITLGTDYPKPIVDHNEARKANLDKMGAAYAAARGEAPKPKPKAAAKPKAAKAAPKVKAAVKRKAKSAFFEPAAKKAK